MVKLISAPHSLHLSTIYILSLPAPSYYKEVLVLRSRSTRACLLLFQYSVKQILTSKALKELLQLISVLLPVDAAFTHQWTNWRSFSSTFMLIPNLLRRIIMGTASIFWSQIVCDCDCGNAQLVTVWTTTESKTWRHIIWPHICTLLVWLERCMLRKKMSRWWTCSWSCINSLITST